MIFNIFLNADKFQGPVLPGSRIHTGVQVSVGYVCIVFVQKINILGICIDGKLNFDEHVHRIYPKASAQIFALQRLTGLIDYPSRKVICTRFIASNFNYCSLVCFFTSRESINIIDKIQESALRYVPKDHIYDFNDFCYCDLGLNHSEYICCEFSNDWVWHQTICLNSLSKQTLHMARKISVNWYNF